MSPLSLLGPLGRSPSSNPAQCHIGSFYRHARWTSPSMAVIYRTRRTRRGQSAASSRLNAMSQRPATTDRLGAGSDPAWTSAVPAVAFSACQREHPLRREKIEWAFAPISAVNSGAADSAPIGRPLPMCSTSLTPACRAVQGRIARLLQLVSKSAPKRLRQQPGHMQSCRRCQTRFVDLCGVNDSHDASRQHGPLPLRP